MLEDEEESGLYYLNSWYYDPETGRFVNADNYVSTGQGLTGFNMFCYCGNNPINRIDVSGHLWKEILEFLQAAAAEIGNAIDALTPVYAGGRAATVIDGPYPFVDAIVGMGILILTIAVAVDAVAGTVQTCFLSVEKEEEDSIAVAQSQTKKQAYFPVNPYDFFRWDF